MNDDDVDKFVKLVVYTWFPYQSSNSCTEVKDITLLDSWFNSAQGHFTRNIDLFPQKVRMSLNGCPMKAIFRDRGWNLISNYINQSDSCWNVAVKIVGMEMNLLSLVLQQMNMTFVYVPTTESINNYNGNWSDDLFWALIAKEADIALCDLQLDINLNSYFDCTNTYYIFSVRWYVPCFVKHPRRSSIFRILSMEMWIILIISIVVVAISTTLVGQYSCTSEWQGYKTLTSSMTNLWAVILVVSVSAMPRTLPYVRSSSPGCVPLWLLAQCSRHFSQRFLLIPVTKHKFKVWKCFMPQVLSLPTLQTTITFSRVATKLNHQKYKQTV